MLDIGNGDLAEPAPPEIVSPLTILLVEDEPLVRWNLAEELRAAGWKVVETSTADDAIELLKSGSAVDLILTDVKMPGRANGLDLARFAARQRPTVKVAVMSGDHEPASSEQRPYHLFFRKPFDDDQMIAQLMSLLQAQDPKAAAEQPISPMGDPDAT